MIFMSNGKVSDRPKGITKLRAEASLISDPERLRRWMNDNLAEIEALAPNVKADLRGDLRDQMERLRGNILKAL